MAGFLSSCIDSTLPGCQFGMLGLFVCLLVVRFVFGFGFGFFLWLVRLLAFIFFIFIGATIRGRL